MLTPKTLACAFFLGAWLLAILTCALGAMHQIAFAEAMARSIIGLRPI